MKRKEEEQRENAETENRKGEEEDELAAEVRTEFEAPVVSVPQDPPPLAIDIDIPSSILQDIEHPSILHDMSYSSEPFFNIPAAAVSSSTLSISTVSDLTPTELGEEIEESEDQVASRHDTFYFDDGNVEIVCGDTIFRVHSTVVSFSSSRLRDTLSPYTLLNAPMPDGCPRVVFKDSAEDFAVLLKMIYTPG